MNSPFSYSTTFVLDKAHFNECFTGSVTVKHSLAAYSKAIVFLLFGMLLSLFTDINQYAAWFLVGLGFVEALAVYYQQPWWVARQMLSRAAHSEVTLTLDEVGIHSHSFYINSTILWPDVSVLTVTEKGLLLKHGKGKSYISGACLSEQARVFLLAKLDAVIVSQ